MSAVLSTPPTSAGIEAIARAEGQDALLTPRALAFLADLQTRFDARRRRLLADRRQRQAFFDGGGLPDFRADTRAIRDGDWRAAPIPRALLDRRVEITGPVDPKMVINALNSGANCYMADFEDSTAPTWANLVEGQRALRDAVAGALAFTGDTGKAYALHPFDQQAVLLVRPRGWHLDE
ncbi:MAG: malate synthase A, partial [Luteimonas sp.]|nr:malate synthase A [Luteimonas sp.]